MLINSQKASENHPSSFVPRLSFIFPTIITKKKNKSAPKKPPRNVVSGDILKIGRNKIIKTPVTAAHIDALLREDLMVGDWEDIF